MIIEKNFSRFVVFAEDNLLSALNKISENKSRIIFAVSESGILEGVLSDGDFRRWLLATPEIDLNQPVSKAMNRDFHAASIDEDKSKIHSMLTPKILAVPLLDNNNRLVAVALPRQRRIEIDGRVISEDTPAFIIAEIGNNHNGSLKLARKLIEKAAEAGADCVKFQMRDLQSLYQNAGDAGYHSADLGTQYTLDLLNRFQLSDSEYYQVFDCCRKREVLPLCTPWDRASFVKLESYGLSAYKIASADFTNYDLISAIANAGKPMICSTGMATESEIQEGIRYLKTLGIPFALLHCNSTYPTPFKDINLGYISHLKELSSSIVGYSGHERDFYVAITAVGMGAKIIEKHFTLDKSMEGNDHKISLLPEEFANMVRGIRQVEEAVGKSKERTISQGEMINRENLAKSLVAAIDIKAGTKITETMVAVQSPGKGLQPNRKKELIGRALSTDKKAGTFFYPADLQEDQIKPRNYNFNRPWGVPVRYHDLHTIINMSNMDFVELHLSYKDMEINFRDYLANTLNLGLTVHAPELFAGDHTLDLCSLDDTYRQRSLSELQRVIDLTRKLMPYFKKAQKPFIITNVGGFSHSGHLPIDSREIMYQKLHESLEKLDTDGVEIIPQTMPPFPWHFGGQKYHNLFVDADSIVDFCSKNSMRICFDASHSKLACNHFNFSFSNFLLKVAPFVAHMHLSDAQGIDGEGLQVGDGDIDWGAFFIIVNKYAERISFIPEIWQGHKNMGEGFWMALERLEKYSKNNVLS